MSNKRRSSGWSRATIETDEEATLQQERVPDVESEQNAEVETDEAVQEQGRRVKFIKSVAVCRLTGGETRSGYDFN